MTTESISWQARSSFDRMMDDIAAAESSRELDHLGVEVAVTFGGHPRRGDLDGLLSGMRRLIASGRGTRLHGAVG